MPALDVAPHRLATLGLLALVPVAGYGVVGPTGAVLTSAVGVAIVSAVLVLAFGGLEGEDEESATDHAA